MNARCRDAGRRAHSRECSLRTKSFFAARVLLPQRHLRCVANLEMEDGAGVIRPDEIVWFTLDEQLRPCVSVNTTNSFIPVTRLRYSGNRVHVETHELVNLIMDDRRPCAEHLSRTNVPRRAAL